MSWYRTGTVAVTNGSTVVTGTGTMFAANNRTGDAFIGPDGKTYEVTNIPTESTISIAPPYLGATASGQVYAIAPMQGYVKESADRLRQATDNYGYKLENIGTMAEQNADDVAITGGSIADAALPTTQAGKTFTTPTTVSTESNNPLVLNSTASTGEVQHKLSSVVSGYTKWNGTNLALLSPNTAKSSGVDNTSAFCAGMRFGNAANSDPTVLDWYEENGTFTVSAIGAVTAGAPSSYTKRTGVYNRIGNLYFCRVGLGWTGHTGSGLLRITGLPVSPARASTASYLNNGLPFSSGNLLTIAISAGSAYIEIYQTAPAGTVSVVNIPANLVDLVLNFVLEV